MIKGIFINRVREKKFFESDVFKDSNRARVIIIDSKSGIGKSTLVDEVIVNIVKYKLEHRVLINQQQAETRDMYFYFKKLVKVLHENSYLNECPYISMGQFIKEQKLVSSICNSLIKTAQSYFGIKIFFEIEESYEANAQTWLNTDIEIISLAKEYVKYILNTSRIFLTIENAQCIDNKSLDILLEILQDNSFYTTHPYIILEYTHPREINANNLLQFRNNLPIDYLLTRFGACSEIQNYCIQQLDKNEIINISPNDNIYQKIIEEHYDNSEGNLFLMKMWLNSNSKLCDVPHNHVTDDILDLVLSTMSPEASIILLIVDLHKGIISNWLLSDILTTQFENEISIEKLNTILEEIKAHNLFDMGNNLIKMRHDSIFSKVAEIERLKRYTAIVVVKLISYYVRQNESKITLDEKLSNYYVLIVLYLKNQSYTQILEVLRNINSILDSYPIINIIDYVNLIDETYKTNKHDCSLDESMTKWFVYIRFRCGYFTQISETTNLDEIKDIPVKLCCIAAISSGNPKKALKIIEEIKFDDHRNYVLALKLLKLRSLRSCGNMEACYNMWMDNYKRKTFINTIFEGDFLRYACLCLHEDYDLRIKCIAKAYDYFISASNIYGTIASAITLMRDYTFLGDYKNATKWLDVSHKYINKSVFPAYNFYNNRAVIDMLTSNISNRILTDLSMAKEVCTDKTDLRTIKINLLCYYIITQNKTNSESVYKDLLKIIIDMENINDWHYQAIVYNCFQYANLKNDILNLEKLRMKFDANKQYFDYGNTLLGVGKCKQIISIKQESYYPCMMVNWDIDYYNALNNYQ